MTKRRVNSLVLLILVIASILRFYNYSEVSITADEVSALCRLQFNSFKDLIEYGVRIDGHPAGVQVLLFYWTKVFGLSEASIRFPFVLAGIFSVLFVYLIASKWFGKASAIFASASICFLEFPLLYSQIARPYSLGLLFSLMAVWFWTLSLFDKKNKNNWVLAGYVASTSLCMYTHYFSFLFALIVGVTGLFFLKQENWKRYILAGIIIAVLFIPHLEIFFHQLSIGGVGGENGWLGKPEPKFILNYITYIFNDSGLLFLVFLLIFILTFLKNYRDKKLSRFHAISLIWFFLPLLIGYFYSIFVNPVLQNSVLIFSFPFLILFLLSFINENWNWQKYLFLLMFMVYGLYNTIIEKAFYQRHHFGILKEIALNTIEWGKVYGEKNITKAINVDDACFINYYFDKYNKKETFASYINNGRDELTDFSKIIDTCSTSYFFYAWSTRYSPCEIPEIIREKYPEIIHKEYYFNSEIYLFGKETKKIKPKENDVIYKSKNTFDYPAKIWAGNEQTISDSIFCSGKHCVKLGEGREYSPTFKAKAGTILKSADDIVNVSLMGYLPSTDCDAQLVIAFEKNGTTYSWNANKLSYFIKDPQQWKKVFFSIRLPEKISNDDEVLIYVWNNKKNPVFIDDMEVKITKGNPVLYGKRDNL